MIGKKWHPANLLAVPAEQGAAAVIFDERGHVLLVKENYERRRYSFPGGAVERDEVPQDAVLREAQEETGVTVAIDHLVGVYRLQNGFVVYAFRCNIVSGTPAMPVTGELSEVAWYSPAAIPQPVSTVLHYALPDAVAGARGVVRDRLPRVS